MPFKPLSCVFGKYFIPQRYILVFMMQLALLNCYHLRVVYNIAITEMLKEPTPNSTEEFVDACPEFTYESVVSESSVQFEWDPLWESFTLYAFYIGYIVTHVPGGWLADKIGARHVMGTCVVVSCLITAVFPILVTVVERGDVTAVALRMILGFAQGPILPTVSAFIQCWVPKEHRAFLGGVAFGGSNIGTVTGCGLTGVIIHETGHWYMPFYVWAAMALLWYIFYSFMVFSGPDSHPFITEAERDQVLEEVPPHGKSFHVPWRAIFRGMPFWALLAGQFGHNFIFFTLVTYLPKYLKDILKMSVRSNALFTSIPFFLLWMFSIIVCYFSDIVTNHKWLSLATARKICTTFSIIVPSAFLLLTGYLGCHRVGAIISYTAGICCIGPFYAGMKINVNDLTIHYAGTIMAVVNGLGATAGILGPYIVGCLTHTRSIDSWLIVFWITMGVSIICSLFYCVFASAERQHWDYADELHHSTSFTIHF
ncbi:unnamed protein product [Acanthoscelides obtectus]|uniref:Major facilitator superfamily (MFS) profile domain-containing protein n=1 Tax=Acanthoscelides obtectus TaxID=200917 RepID=A0A9P0PPQ3_ACAOB|nr:unnamed protein product [Acanthoscelides obtectus]CAK1638875.1 Putative inorganic phosphate cotransporter [Acanthoscelides obtectus]